MKSSKKDGGKYGVTVSVNTLGVQTYKWYVTNSRSSIGRFIVAAGLEAPSLMLASGRRQIEYNYMNDEPFRRVDTRLFFQVRHFSRCRLISPRIVRSQTGHTMLLPW